MRGDLTEEPQGIRLVAAFLVRTGMGQRALGEPVRLLQVAMPQIRLPQGELRERLVQRQDSARGLLDRLRQQRHRVGDAPAERVRGAQGRRYQGERGRGIDVLADTHRPFEAGACPVQVALTQREQTAPPRGKHQTAGMRRRLSNVQPLFPQDMARRERAEIGMAPGEPGTGTHLR